MTTTPHPAVREPSIPGVDAWLDGLAVTTADMLAGLIAAGLLETAGRPERLPALVWPHVDPRDAEAIFAAGAAAGLWAGQRRSSVRWEPEALDVAVTSLREAGFEAMSARVAVTAAHGRHPADGPGDGGGGPSAPGVPGLEPHPADADVPPETRPVRDGHQDQP